MTRVEEWCRAADNLLADPKACQRALDDHDADDGSCYCPTPEEIRAACREIQSSWTPEEERARRVSRPMPLEIGTYRIAKQEKKLPK